ncbi:Protein CBG01155 [Caenorhabditis briggsae]|uniref:Protein CBG01155 n=1 Tax=Caenorhabditis briggsae TaxID=6238 RepID=A8WPP8_CAEBR|nr:Protein CBG01155 [Caenorhabditis briggsae]CAP22455.1 Protein CBG01155 [Caenorhabditis briggsae]
MYINWIHQYLPGLFGILAFIVNPIFVYLIFTEKIANFGNYRFILLIFAIFNLFYSTTMFLVPVHVYNYRYSFSIFTSGGFFQKSSDLNLIVLCARCSLVSGSYAILLSHFFYRYLVIKISCFINKKFHLYLLATLFVFLIYIAVWFSVGLCVTYEGRNEYIRENFRMTFGVDPEDFNIVTAIYNEAPRRPVILSFCGIFFLTFLSMITCTMFATLGYLTMRKINNMAKIMSQKTARIQRELLKALTVQTVIPLCVSFSPCLLGWYSPMFNIDLGKVINLIEVVTLSAFPFLDPIAIVLCVPVFRKRLFPSKKVVEIQSTALNTTIHS